MSPIILSFLAVAVPEAALVWADVGVPVALGLAGVLAASAAGLFAVRDRRAPVRRVVPRLPRTGGRRTVPTAA